MRLISGMPVRHQVLARYSILKTGACIAGLASLFGWIVLEGVANGWAPPPGTMHPGRYLLGYAVAPLGILAVAAMLIMLVMRRGVAMLASQDEIILNSSIWPKRIPLNPGLEVRATLHGKDVPPSFVGLNLMPGSFALPQITFSRANEPDVNLRSSLLSENAEIIAARVAKVIAGTRNSH